MSKLLQTLPLNFFFSEEKLRQIHLLLASGLCFGKSACFPTVERFPGRLPSPCCREALTLHTGTTLCPSITDPTHEHLPAAAATRGLCSLSSCRTCAVAGAPPGDAHGKPLVPGEAPGSASSPAPQPLGEFSGEAARVPHGHPTGAAPGLRREALSRKPGGRGKERG